MSFTLRAGLAFRRGAQTLELTRELPDGSWCYEDCCTRRPGTLAKHKLLKAIWTGDIVLLGHDAAAPPLTSNAQAVPLVSYEDLKGAHAEDLKRKMAYVVAVRQAHVSRGMRRPIERLIPQVAERIKDPSPPSGSTVMRWLRMYETSMQAPQALVTGNAQRVRRSKLHPEMDRLIGETIRKAYLTRDRHSLRHALTMIRAQARSLVASGKVNEAETRISLSTLSRRVNALDRYRVIEAREGASRARMVTRTAMDGTVALYPFDVVEVDHTPLNWVVICDRTGLPLGRPMLTVMIDAYSGYVVGFYISFYGAGLSSVSGVVRCALMPKEDMVAGIKLEHQWLANGIPDSVRLDNGLEFHSPMFQRMGWELGTSFTYCRVRTPWLKPHVERFFGSLDTLTLTRGRVHKRLANVVQLDPDEDAAIMFSAFVRGLVMYVVDYHPFQVNERKLARPYDLMQEGLTRVPPARFPHDLERLRMVSAMSKQLTVHQGGVELHGLPYGGPELLSMRRALGTRFKTWVKWDPDDMSQVWIQDPKSQSWVASSCRWAEYANGLSWNQHLQIRKFARLELKSSGAYEYLERARLRLHEHWQESVSWKSRADQRLAARYSGATSARVLSAAPSERPKPVAVCAEPISAEQVKAYSFVDPDDFQAIDL
ncbi:Mu transposase C-terminal domain-containing protein [Kinneretia aquatilis]|uniref:Mu transposase C-terminal domain-containing protein n=1 Tax=Kinneretia aquatilis TaxID=2070761 RepID=UPI0014950749|nr:Mu transposase C-terminal domain-containing protein [Paucibacter aquatile]WIV97496.1 Mu transposase C-terminal domain-containing protein [Paucibacter aquatile]